ncbi:glycoside hydrolase [Sulfodiicoccus acidiphilus]|nr:glycoside hydrolase family 15 protein [Sulfodiicoccus acidiphilus]BBD73672.1 glycoside hydrolase [Sulfodiicoccus acidiphilus]
MLRHGFVSNRMTGALISPDGTVDWLTFPRFDSPAVFNKFLDKRWGGALSVLGEVEPIRQTYIVPNVLSTEVRVDGHQVKFTDLLPLGEHSFMRLVEAYSEVELEVRLLFDYGMIRPVVEYSDENARFLNPRGRDCVSLIIGGRKVDDLVWRLPAGRSWVYMNYSTNVRHGFLTKGYTLNFDLERAFKFTLSYWRRETAAVRNPLRTSYGVLLGLTYSPTSGVVAAPTTSLPEVDGGTRNWDYRFSWIRDSAIVAEGFVDVKDYVSARRILAFLLSLMNVTTKPFLHPLYAIDGSDPPPERELRWLPGYRDSRPVRVGNAASEQVQLDVEGFFVSSLLKYVKATNDVPMLREAWPKLEYLADWVSFNWRSPDVSLWEERGTPRHYTHSKAMMWIALKDVGEMASLLDEEDRWGRERDELRDWILENSVVQGHLVRYPGATDVDAALLSLPLYGFTDVRDPLFLETLREVELKLKVGPFVKRYSQDFMGEARHPFLLTSLWLARVYLKLGRIDEAVNVVRALLDVAGELGLLGEHVDVERGEFTGNFPQAFVHAQLLSTLKEMDEMGVKI